MRRLLGIGLCFLPFLLPTADSALVKSGDWWMPEPNSFSDAWRYGSLELEDGVVRIKKQPGSYVYFIANISQLTVDDILVLKVSGRYLSDRSRVSISYSIGGHHHETDKNSKNFCQENARIDIAEGVFAESWMNFSAEHENTAMLPLVLSTEILTCPQCKYRFLCADIYVRISLEEPLESSDYEALGVELSKVEIELSNPNANIKLSVGDLANKLTEIKQNFAEHKQQYDEPLTVLPADNRVDATKKDGKIEWKKRLLPTEFYCLEKDSNALNPATVPVPEQKTDAPEFEPVQKYITEFEADAPTLFNAEFDDNGIVFNANSSAKNIGMELIFNWPPEAMEIEKYKLQFSEDISDFISVEAETAEGETLYDVGYHREYYIIDKRVSRFIMRCYSKGVPRNFRLLGIQNVTQTLNDN